MNSRRVIYFMGIILLFNLFTWFLWGRESTLKIASQEFKTAGTCFADTIHVFKGEENLPWYKSQYSDFTSVGHDKFKKGLKYKTFSLQIHAGTFQNGQHNLPEYLDYSNSVYSFDIIGVIPFFAIVNKYTLAGSGSASFRSLHIWFFRWWRINDKLIGIS